jgi:hypothetical protein
MRKKSQKNGVFDFYTIYGVQKLSAYNNFFCELLAFLSLSNTKAKKLGLFYPLVFHSCPTLNLCLMLMNHLALKGQ